MHLGDTLELLGYGVVEKPPAVDDLERQFRALWDIGDGHSLYIHPG